MNNIFVVNLKERTDRRENMIKQFEKYSIINYKFFNAIKPTKNDLTLWNSNFAIGRSINSRLGALGCLKSHIEIFKNALESNLEYVIMLEDDAEIKDNFNLKNLEEDIENYLKDKNLGIFYFGCTHLKHPIKINKNIHKCVFSYTTHAYLITKQCMNFIVNNINNYDREIDHFYTQFIQKKFNCYCYYPSLIKQLDGFSDIEGKQVSYNM